VVNEELFKFKKDKSYSVHFRKANPQTEVDRGRLRAWLAQAEGSSLFLEGAGSPNCIGLSIRPPIPASARRSMSHLIIGLGAAGCFSDWSSSGMARLPGNED
jgi:hypothetical protein